jgi:hypothetical protein
MMKKELAAIRAPYEGAARWTSRIAVALALTLTAANAFAQEPPQAGQPPKRGDKAVEIPVDELRRMLDEITQQGYVDADEISIDSLAHPGDKEAYDKAQELTSDRIAAAVRSLAVLKQRVIRYAVIARQSAAFQTDRKARQDIVRSYQNQFQALYNEFVNSLMLPMGSRQEALNLCKSDVCVISLSSMMIELDHFAAQIDRGLDFQKMNDQTEIFWNFENPLLKASFSRAFKKIVPPNRDVHLVRATIAGFYAPLSVAGTATFDTVRQVVSLANARFEWLSIDVEPARKQKEYKTQREYASRLFRDQLGQVGLDHNGKNRRIIDWERRMEYEAEQRRILAQEKARLKARFSDLLKTASAANCIHSGKRAAPFQIKAASSLVDENDTGYRLVNAEQSVIKWSDASDLFACSEYTEIKLNGKIIDAAKTEETVLMRAHVFKNNGWGDCMGKVMKVSKSPSTGLPESVDVRWITCSGYGEDLPLLSRLLTFRVK